MKPNFELLARAHEIIDGIPARRFNLAFIAQNTNEQDTNLPHDCGTVGCALGWLGMHPEFRALGLKTNAVGTLEPLKGSALFANVAAEVFDITEQQARSLFGLSYTSVYDVGFPRKMSDKQLFKRRMRQFFIDHGQPVSQD